MQDAKLLAVTGAAGRLGRLLVPSLVRDHREVRLLDRLAGEVDGLPVVAAPLEHREKMLAELQGTEAIVHLGGVSTEASYPEIRAGNLDGVFNLYDAARHAGVRRVIFASSHHAVGYYPRGEAVGVDSMPRPDTLYAASKVFGEAIARLHWDKHGIETAVVRIGSVQPRPLDPRMLSTWLSPADFTELIARLLAMRECGFRILYGISNNAAAWWPVPEVEGWMPRNRGEDHPLEPDEPRDEPFQGGHFTRLDGRG